MATWDWERVSPTRIESGKGEVPVGKIRDPFLKIGRWGTEQADPSWAHSAFHERICGCQPDGEGAGDWERGGLGDAGGRVRGGCLVT